MLGKILCSTILFIISISLQAQQVEEWQLIYDGTNASEFQTNIAPNQFRVFDYKHLGFVDGRRSFSGHTISLTLSDSSYKEQFKALKFKYPDSVWVIIQDWNYINDKLIYVLADSCKIRLFDGVNIFYSYKSFILKSQDGGKSWTNISINENWRPNPSVAISMYNSMNGIISQYQNQSDSTEKTDLMWKTEDGWKTKNQISLNSKMIALNNVKYFEPSIIIAKNINNSIFYSNNDGLNWEIFPIPKELILNGIQYENLYILNKQTIYFVSSSNSQQTGYNRSIIAKSSNSGRTWDKLYDKYGADSIVSNISFVNDSTFYIHGPKIRLTSDNGKSWIDKSKEYVTNFESPVYSFYFLPDSSKIALTYLKIFFTKNKFTLSTPLYLSPENYYDIPLDFELKWSEITGAKKYQVQIVQRDGVPWYDLRPPATFDTILFADEIISTGVSFKLKGTSNYKEYSCRIRALNDTQTSVWNYKAFTTKNSTGIDEAFPDITYIYPNPVSDFLSIYSSKEYSKIEIFSAFGLKVLETELNDKIDVSGLSPGMYFVKIGNAMNKFIKL